MGGVKLMPVRRYHDDELPPKPPHEAEKYASVIAAVVSIAVIILIFAYH
jgi:hypothetical protein